MRKTYGDGRDNTEHSREHKLLEGRRSAALMRATGKPGGDGLTEIAGLFIVAVLVREPLTKCSTQNAIPIGMKLSVGCVRRSADRRDVTLTLLPRQRVFDAVAEGLQAGFDDVFAHTDRA